MRSLEKGVSGKPYPRLCNARRPRLKLGIFWSQAVRLYRLQHAKREKERKPGLAFGPMDSRNDDDTILLVNAIMIKRPLFFFLKKGIMSMLAAAFKPSHVYL